MTAIDNSLNSLINELSLGSTQTEQTNNDQLGQSEFLELMITQLKNQDPFSPMENGEFIAQMAQFSTVTGLSELQQSFEQLASSLSSNQALQASTLVGRSVMVPSIEGVLTDGGTISGAVDLPISSNSVMVNIYDDAGQIVRTLGLGSQAAGTVDFSWDGYDNNGSPAPAGHYYLSATANINNETEALETLVNNSVESVTLNSNYGMALNLADGRIVSISSVREIR
jgi:flagellar basal-body rod modification protein FlgD